MPRKPRFTDLHYPQHIIHRGNNRRSIFASEIDYRTYVGMLVRAVNKYDCVVHAYVLMTNHVHLLIGSAMEHGVSLTMQWVSSRYAEYVNRRYGSTGSLWEGRYKSSLVGSDAYVLTCYRYIELNPVRACMVTNPAEYRWSSYRCNALGVKDEVISPHLCYLNISSVDRTRELSYRNWCSISPRENELEEIRAAANRELAYGSEVFKEQIEKAWRRRVSPGHPGRPVGK